MKASDFLAIAPMFASEDGTRKAFETSFRHGHHLFVTDGHIALVTDAYSLDTDGIFETRDLEQRRIGDKIIADIEAREKDVCSGKYHGYGLCCVIAKFFCGLIPNRCIISSTSSEKRRFLSTSE